MRTMTRISYLSLISERTLPERLVKCIMVGTKYFLGLFANPMLPGSFFPFLFALDTMGNIHEEAKKPG